MGEQAKHTPEEILEAARSEVFAFGRCCDLYQDGFGAFHCSECGQKTFAMLEGVQNVLGDGSERKQGHSESICLALLRGKALETAAERDALKAELAKERNLRRELANVMNELMDYPQIMDCHGGCFRCGPCKARAALAKARELEEKS